MAMVVSGFHTVHPLWIIFLQTVLYFNFHVSLHLKPWGSSVHRLTIKVFAHGTKIISYFLFFLGGSLHRGALDQDAARNLSVGLFTSLVSDADDGFFLPVAKVQVHCNAYFHISRHLLWELKTHIYTGKSKAWGSSTGSAIYLVPPPAKI